MRRPWPWYAASFLALLAVRPLAAATVLERSVQIEVRADGSLSESTRLAVRLESDDDWRSWSPYPIYLDDHRTLESLSATVTRPDGKTAKLSKKDLDTVAVAGDGVLHSSQRYRTVSFPAPLPRGSVLSLEYVALERPYFPARSIPLAWDEAVEKLRVEVRGPALRWRLAGSLPGLEVREVPGGVAATATGLPRRQPVDLAPGESPAALRLAWGPESSWPAVGRWYEGLLAQLPRAAEPVRATARQVIAGREGRRERLEALLDLVRRDVRYVAVEVGIGGYRPSAPQEVLERRWGDCKDKALLLVELLREAGIEAWPALVHAGEDERVDREFPNPGQFNHAIVAVPVAGLDLPADAPVAEGLLFLDATQTGGALSWLHPAVQDQEALVVRPGGASTLVRTPIRESLEARRMDVEVAISPEGEARGQVRLELTGRFGAAFLERLATQRPEEMERDVRRTLGGLLPGVDLGEVRWSAPESEVPTIALSAWIRIPGLLQGGGAAAFLLPGLAGTPVPRVLEDRDLPVVVSPTSDRFSWRITMPTGACAAEAQDLAVENGLGSVRQSVAATGDLLTVERRTEMRRRWIEPTDFAALKELSLAEHRAHKRRIRVACGGA